MRHYLNPRGFPSRAAHRTGPACAGVLRPETVARTLRPKAHPTLKRIRAR